MGGEVLSPFLPFALSLFFFLALASPARAVTEIPFGAGKSGTELSGYAKSLNIFSTTTTASPELLDSPLLAGERDEHVFNSMDRIRLETKTHYNFTANERLLARLVYDHQTNFGSAVGTGEFRLAEKQADQRQLLDLSQTLVEKNGALYKHKFYRASVSYESGPLSVEAGRQLIPWGVGRFFVPTDLFNPFVPTQLEIEEREGVDAVNVTAGRWKGCKTQLVYTPRGKKLHPQRFFGRVSNDIKGFETGILGGFIHKDFAMGFDTAGNIKDTAVRGEFLFRNPDGPESPFVKFTVNADYNLPHNVYALLEYHFNGEGRHDRSAYQLGRALGGDIAQLARNYLALSLRHDLTTLIRLEHRTILNMDDLGLYLRPEIQYEFLPNTVLTAAAQIFTGGKRDEYGAANNVYFGELKYSF